MGQYREWYWGMVRGGGGKEGAGEEWWETLLTSYSESWRHYHTNRHIYSMLK